MIIRVIVNRFIRCLMYEPEDWFTPAVNTPEELLRVSDLLFDEPDLFNMVLTDTRS